jgi:acetyl-CoA C-acetyltransferase
MSAARRLEARDPVVAGWGMVPFRRADDDSSPRDWVRTVCRDAIASAHLERHDIDAVIIACESDHLSLQLSPSALLADEVGLVPKDAVRVESGGASGANAVRIGVTHLLSGLARRVLVCGFEHAASHLRSSDVRLLYGLSFDADLEGWTGVTPTNLYALSILLHMRRHGTTRSQLAAVAVKNRANALANPFAHQPGTVTIDDVLASRIVSSPYGVLDCSPLSDGAAALVLSRADALSATGRPRIAITGSGCATDHVRLGDRADASRFTSKTLSAGDAFRQASIANPAQEIDVAELYDSYTGAEIQSLEALGLAEEGRAAHELENAAYGPDGRMPVNLSGGLIGQGGAPGAVGIAQVITVARVLAGEYPLRPSRRLPLRGLADAHGGVANVSVTHVLQRFD